MTDLITHLARFSHQPALITAAGRLTYTELAEEVADVRSRLGRPRRLILAPMRRDIPSLVAYLGALAGRHVVIPVPPDRDTDAIIDTYRPDSVLAAGGGIDARAEPGGHRLHPDLALLMSTSGSTGDPKLVRLSRRNLISNAESIARYLRIDGNDRAATTLPFSYCYGLSVVHTHLLRGAALALTEDSVIDAEFWDLFTDACCTSLAGVPHTFELLDRIDFAHMRLPRLRYLTQAGGRMKPERVRRYAELGRCRGWDLYVMYGATEATARMAYLPPELAATHPAAIGRPIAGGRFTIEPVDDWTEPGAGELVYHGPNVMLGYAESPADLALGRTVDELRTGDIARIGADGLYEILGRRARYLKLYGLRIDLQRVQDILRGNGVDALCTGDGNERLLVAVDAAAPGDVAALAADAAGVPRWAVTVVTMAELPRLPSGKPDYAAVRTAAAPARPAEGEAGVQTTFADVLHIDPGRIRPDSTFVSLGGTSLNYVTASVLLEPVVGRLPPGWQQWPIARLEQLTAGGAGRSGRRWFQATLETSVALRAAAILLIVGSHVGLFELWGGAHILLGVAGYNFGRFCLTPVIRAERIRHLRTTIAWIAVPSIAWVAVTMPFIDDYHWSNLLLANKILGPSDSMTAGRLWFVEVLVYTLIALALIFAVPAMDRIERRHPFASASVFLAFGIALRYDLPGFQLGHQAWFTFVAFWFFAAGWAAGKARTDMQRLIVTAVMVVCVPGYFDNPLREALVLGGFLLLIWAPALRAPAPLPRIAGVLAEASLFIYLTHFQVYALIHGHPVWATVSALVVGILVARLVRAVRGTISRRRRRISEREAELCPSVP
ncbi:acyl-CoA synthetase (AMP-forming)/AMP-acid ligase II [Mycolicibacterium chubuense NBB4]|uniref:Acyl-CoA synthetase (AMP-forming)/AMP-acid ligase II n=1 Tax=Mycolicibacterium chubuense (strain NBB4) TaxID=710421 RepID=I4BKC4_MYCCN|nr:AMP-binding protein [Mycolicibacterium chubuense]AFM17731.1 acyl-CoA synthetase (AMP-forming)/AMP-acid ligase II [Mycolicibacterium chubuense NBB4]